MKKNLSKWLAVTVIAAMSAVSFLSSCNSSSEGVDENGNPIPTAHDSLQVALANQDSLLVLMNDISEGMMQIKSMENILAAETNLGGENESKRERIKNDMIAIQNALQERRQRLEELEKRLANSSHQNALLKKSIETLKAQIAEQETTINQLRDQLAQANIQIDQLTQSVDSLNTTVEDITQKKEEAEQKNTDLTNEMNTVYYIVGSGKELKEAGVTKDGGFLRSDKINPSEFNSDTFIKADKRELRSINLYSKKAKVLTSQPTESYEIEDVNGQKVLVIKDAKRFWNASSYLVVKTD
ncbi:MAG: hypothetical protein ACI30S_04085 [Muribaculaceae bacterium]